MKFHKITVISSVLGLSFLAFAPAAQAVCPVCTFAVGAGLGLARWFGVDDLVTGLWIGALTLSMTAWTVNWLAKRGKRFAADFWVLLAAYVVMIFVPLWFQGIVGHPLNTFWGVDKIILGSAIGGVVFAIMAKAYEILKAKNGGHAHFPFQKVVMPVAPLLALSLVFYLVTKR
jgi:hypothetical protein